MNPPLPRIGSHQLTGRAVLAPMAGVTDRPFRQLCRRLGAALAASEMVTSDVRLWQTPKTPVCGGLANTSVGISRRQVTPAPTARLSVAVG